MITIPEKIDIYIRKDNYAFAVPANHEKYKKTASYWAGVDHTVLKDQINSFSKVKIIDYEDRKSGSILKVEDSRGLIFDLRMKATIDILTEKGIGPGGEILTDLYIAQNGSQIVFIGKDTKLDKECQKEFKVKLSGKKSKLEIGKQYINGKKDSFIYLGNREYFDTHENKYKKGHVQIYYPILLNHNLKYKSIEDIYNDLPKTYNEFLTKYKWEDHGYYIPCLKTTKSLPTALEEEETKFSLNEFNNNLFFNYRLHYLTRVVNDYKYSKIDINKYSKWHCKNYTSKLDIIFNKTKTIFLGTKEQFEMLKIETQQFIDYLDNKYKNN